MTDRCEELAALVVARRLGVLEASDQARVDAHMASGCPRCSRVEKELEGALEGAELPARTPAPRVKEKLLASIRAERAATGRLVAWPSRVGRLAVAAALLAAVGLGGFVLSKNNRHNEGPRVLAGRVVVKGETLAAGAGLEARAKVSALEPTVVRLADASVLAASPGAAFALGEGRDVSLAAGEVSLVVPRSEGRFVVKTAAGNLDTDTASWIVSVAETDMNAKTVSAGALTVVVGVGAVHFLSAEGLCERTFVAGERAVVKNGSIEVSRIDASGSGTSQVSDLSRENAALRAKVSALAAETALLESRIAALQRAGGSTPSVDIGGVPNRTNRNDQDDTQRRLTVAFGDWAKSEALKKLDFRACATSIQTNFGLARELAQRLAAGEKVDPDLYVKLAKETSKVHQAALSLAGSLPTHSTGVGEFTHPIVVANLMAQQLELAGLPLSDAQVGAINQIGSDFDKAYAARQATYGADTPLVEELTDEVELKKQADDAIQAVLTPDQQAIVIDPGTHDLMTVDVYSPLLLLAGRAYPVALDSRGAITKACVDAWTDRWKLSAAQHNTLELLADKWLSDAAPNLTAVPAAQAPYFHCADAVAAGRATVALMKELLRGTKPEEPLVKAILEDGTLAVPRLVQAR